MNDHTTSGYMLYAQEQRSAAESLIALSGDEAAIANAKTTIGQLLLANWQSLSEENQSEWHALYMERYDLLCKEIGFISAHAQWEKEFGSLSLMEGVMSGISPAATALVESWSEDDEPPSAEDVLDLQATMKYWSIVVIK